MCVCVCVCVAFWLFLSLVYAFVQWLFCFAAQQEGWRRALEDLVSTSTTTWIQVKLACVLHQRPLPLTHTHAHTHTLSLTLPPPTLLPHSAFSFAPSCICQTLNTAIWSVISAKERLCPPDGLLRRMYTIFKVMSPVLACGLMGCSSQPGFQDLCVDFKVCCSPSSLFFFFFFFLLLRAPTFLLTHCTHTRARTAQDFVEQGTKDWFQFDANKHHSATDLAEEMKALWYRKGDEAKVIVARHS